MDTPPAQKERELKIRAQQAEFELFSKLPPDLHFFFHELLRLARVYTSLGDLEHYQTTRLSLPLRKGLHELGSRLVQRRVLEEPMDIFFGHWKQVDAAVRRDDKKVWEELPADIRGQLETAMQESTDYANTIAKQKNDEDLESVKASGKTEVTVLTEAQRGGFSPTPGLMC